MKSFLIEVVIFLIILFIIFIGMYSDKNKNKKESIQQEQQKEKIEKNNKMIGITVGPDFEVYEIKTIKEKCNYLLITVPENPQYDPAYIEITEECNKYKIGDKMILTLAGGVN